MTNLPSGMTGRLTMEPHEVGGHGLRHPVRREGSQRSGSGPLIGFEHTAGQHHAAQPAHRRYDFGEVAGVGGKRARDIKGRRAIVADFCGVMTQQIPASGSAEIEKSGVAKRGTKTAFGHLAELRHPHCPHIGAIVCAPAAQRRHHVMAGGGERRARTTGR